MNYPGLAIRLNAVGINAVGVASPHARAASRTGNLIAFLDAFKAGTMAKGSHPLRLTGFEISA
jgi:hypothetical protein